MNCIKSLSSIQPLRVPPLFSIHTHTYLFSRNRAGCITIRFCCCILQNVWMKLLRCCERKGKICIYSFDYYMHICLRLLNRNWNSMKFHSIFTTGKLFRSTRDYNQFYMHAYSRAAACTALGEVLMSENSENLLCLCARRTPSLPPPPGSLYSESGTRTHRSDSAATRRGSSHGSTDDLRRGNERFVRSYCRIMRSKSNQTMWSKQPISSVDRLQFVQSATFDWCVCAASRRSVYILLISAPLSSSSL